MLSTIHIPYLIVKPLYLSCLQNRQLQQFWLSCAIVNKEGGNHLEQETNRQKAMEDIDGGGCLLVA